LTDEIIHKITKGKLSARRRSKRYRSIRVEKNRRYLAKIPMRLTTAKSQAESSIYQASRQITPMEKGGRYFHRKQRSS
jgi:hypothetical protein